MKRRILVYVLMFILIFSFGCSSQGEMEYEESVEMNDAAMEASGNAGPGSDDVKYGGIQTNRKVIQRASVVMETLKFDDTVQTIKDNTYEFAGYFETMRVDGKRMDRQDHEQRRDAYFVIRIPKDKYENFMNAFEKMGNIVVNELTSEDVTDRYVDTEARLKTLKVQEQRLLEILDTATEVEDIIQLEERLSEVRYDIEGYTGTIRKWDNLVEFTTVELNIHEVQKVTEPKPEGVMSRSADQFGESVGEVIEILEGLVVFMIGFTPYLVILIPLGLIVRFIFKYANDHKEEKPKGRKVKYKTAKKERANKNLEKTNHLDEKDNK